MLTTSRDIERRLEKEGWVLVHVAGSHHVFRNPKTGAVILCRILRRTSARVSSGRSTKRRAGLGTERAR
ncbi:MAG TPA: type II toxin-antitoxin system HicA family toxin [Methylosinus sp.]|uniref:type II toxin-antitoxin system HicA family toxin n=1 Tax=Methylosinus sp. TaxID=427 RepID=UPI002F9495DD